MLLTKHYNLISKIVLNFKFSVHSDLSPFWGSWSARWAMSENCAKWKYFNSNLCTIGSDVAIKGLRSRILVFHTGPWYSTWAIWESWQSCMQQSCCRLWDSTSHMQFSPVDWLLLTWVVNVSCSDSGYLSLIHAGCWNSLLPSTILLAWARTSPHVLWWSDCSASEEMSKKCLA